MSFSPYLFFGGDCDEVFQRRRADRTTPETRRTRRL